MDAAMAAHTHKAVMGEKLEVMYSPELVKQWVDVMRTADWTLSLTLEPGVIKGAALSSVGVFRYVECDGEKEMHDALALLVARAYGVIE